MEKVDQFVKMIGQESTSMDVSYVKGSGTDGVDS
jgi:hypothetical protein